MQNMDSTILKTHEKSLTNTQEKFLDALFGEARGNPKKAGELAGYSAKQILDRIGIVKKEQMDINMKAMHGLFILPPKEEPKESIVTPVED